MSYIGRAGEKFIFSAYIKEKISDDSLLQKKGEILLLFSGRDGKDSKFSLQPFGV